MDRFQLIVLSLLFWTAGFVISILGLTNDWPVKWTAIPWILYAIGLSLYIWACVRD